MSIQTSLLILTISNSWIYSYNSMLLCLSNWTSNKSKTQIYTHSQPPYYPHF
uniref:Uncharacterized protein n=1 Tax=Rhizophora mucronata TaxID=61149 RepID=A0A2P2JBF5_RHIMU